MAELTRPLIARHGMGRADAYDAALLLAPVRAHPRGNRHAIGDITGVIHAAGVSPSQAPPATILAVDLYGTALVLEEFGNVIASGGAGAVIASLPGHPSRCSVRGARDELNGPRGDGYRRMIELSPAGRAGTPDEVATVAALLMGPDGTFITGSDILMDGGVTASYFYGDLALR